MTSRKSEKRTSIQMHRFVLNLKPEDSELDHVNRNGLDNRKSNLRKATRSNQMANARKRKGELTSKFKGVCWTRRRWQSNITVNGKQIYLGRFKDETEAALAYDTAAKEHFGEYAKTNF